MIIVSLKVHVLMSLLNLTQQTAGVEWWEIDLGIYLFSCVS